MAKYVGITSRDPEDRRAEHQKKDYPGLHDWTIISRGLTYEQAQAKENELKNRGYKAHYGGEKVQGAVYVVYTFQYVGM